MINYTPTSQQKIEGFATPFSAKLSPTNRWVELGGLIPWDKLAEVYYRPLERKKGRESLNARIAIGAMIIKHKLKLSDRETVSLISENPYMQHFVGLDRFQSKPLFDASLFVKLRKRMGAKAFDEFTTILIKEVQGIEQKKGSNEKGEKRSQRAKEGKQELGESEREDQSGEDPKVGGGVSKGKEIIEEVAMHVRGIKPIKRELKQLEKIAANQM